MDLVDSGHLKSENAKLQAEVDSLKKQVSKVATLKPDSKSYLPWCNVYDVMIFTCWDDILVCVWE